GAADLLGQRAPRGDLGRLVVDGPRGNLPDPVPYRHAILADQHDLPVRRQGHDEYRVVRFHVGVFELEACLRSQALDHEAAPGTTVQVIPCQDRPRGGALAQMSLRRSAGPLAWLASGAPYWMAS